MNSEQLLLEAKNIHVLRGGASVLEISQFSLRQGEIMCLVGPNGSGKSTLLLTLCSLLERQAGELLFKSRPVADRQSALAFRRSTATVFQEPLLFDMTVQDNVASGLKIRGLPAREIRQRVEQNLERFRIAHLAFLPHASRLLPGGTMPTREALEQPWSFSLTSTVRRQTPFIAPLRASPSSTWT